MCKLLPRLPRIAPDNDVVLPHSTHAPGMAASVDYEDRLRACALHGVTYAARLDYVLILPVGSSFGSLLKFHDWVSFVHCACYRNTFRIISPCKCLLLLEQIQLRILRSLNCKLYEPRDNTVTGLQAACNLCES